MNAVISEKRKVLDESKTPVSKLTEEDRQRRIVAAKALAERRIEECKLAPPPSKEERERRRLNFEAAAEIASREAKEKGLTEEILEELLKDI